MIPRTEPPSTREELIQSLEAFHSYEIPNNANPENKGAAGYMFQTYMGVPPNSLSEPDLRELKCELKAKLIDSGKPIWAQWVELMDISPDIEKIGKKGLLDEYGWESTKDGKRIFTMRLTIANPNSRGFFLKFDSPGEKVVLAFDPERANKVDSNIQKWVQGKKKDFFPLWTSTKLYGDLFKKFSNLVLGVADAHPRKNPETFLFHTIYLCEELRETV